MARAYVTIRCNRGEIRKYGGNVSDVRYMNRRYINMTEDQFLEKHPHLLTEDYLSLNITYSRKNH